MKNPYLPLRYGRALSAAAANDRKYGWGSVRSRRAWLRFAHAVSPRMVEGVESHHRTHAPLADHEWRRGT